MPSSSEKESIEGFGIVFLEASYYELPVIGSFSGGIVEAIVNNKTGFLIKPNNLDDLVEKILYLYNNPEIRAKMGRDGHNRVVQEFNSERIYQDYMNSFLKFIKT